MTLHVIATAMCHAEVVLAEFTVCKRWSFTARCDPRRQSPGRQKSSRFPFRWRLNFVFSVQIAEISGERTKMHFSVKIRKNTESCQHWYLLLVHTWRSCDIAITPLLLYFPTHRLLYPLYSALDAFQNPSLFLHSFLSIVASFQPLVVELQDG